MSSSIENLLSHFPSGIRILDIGCGTGRHAIELAGRGFSVWAVDADGDAVETARNLSGAGAGRGVNAVLPSWAVARGEALPFRDGAFDAVLCLDVLHWSPDQTAFDAVWNEAWRVLAAGGTFVARLPCRDGFPDAVALGGGRFRLATGAEWFLAGKQALMNRVTAAGATLVSLEQTGDKTRFLARRRASVD